MYFIAAFGTPAVCCQRYLLHLEGLIVLLMGTETWTPHFRIPRQPWPQHSQPPGFAKPGCPSQHRQALCSSFLLSPESHRCFCSNGQAHRYSKTLSQNSSTTIKSLSIVPNAPSRQHREQHPSGRGGGGARVC